MENKTLTAKEWLEKEEVYNSYIDHSKQGEEIGLIQFSEIMEKYANYKNRILEEKIMEFRELLKESDVSYGEQCVMPKVKGSYDLYKQIEVFDEHFNIK